MKPPVNKENKFCPFLPFTPVNTSLLQPNQQAIAPMPCQKEFCAIYDEETKKCSLREKINVNLEHKEIKSI